MNQFEVLLSSLLEGTGQSLEQSGREVAAYAATRTAILATLVGQVGYEQAVIAERDAVALFAGLQVVSNADGLRDRILGAIQGALFMAAGALSAAAGPTDEGSL